MLYEEPATRELLQRIAAKVSRDPVLTDDLVQEALIHLWLLEVRRPQQTLSWYLQNCHYYLLNHMQAGRSIDAVKRRQRSLPFSVEEAEAGSIDTLVSNGTLLSEVSAQEIMELLVLLLNPVEVQVLQHLEQGMGVTEIAEDLGISHQAVSKHRSKIARLATQVGLTLPP